MKKLVKEITKTHDQLWQKTLKHFKKLGITYDDPRGLDLFGINRYNELLDQYKNAFLRQKIKSLSQLNPKRSA